MKPAFRLDVSFNERTGAPVAVYLRVREGKIAQTRQAQAGVAFADDDPQGLLLGIELLAPCQVEVLEQLSQSEPEPVRRFLKGGAPGSWSIRRSCLRLGSSPISTTAQRLEVCWMRGLLLLGVWMMGTAAIAQDRTAPLPKQVKPQLVVRGISFAEGPTFDSKGNLFFVNYKGNGNIGRRTSTGAIEVWLRLPDPPAGRDGKVRRAFPFGLKADRKDRLIAADSGGRRLLRISPDKRVETLADSYQGQPFNNPNDVCLDRAGNIYFTDPQGQDKGSVGAIYRYSKGRLTRLHTGLKYPNGLVVAPDQKTLYVAETWTRSVVAFDLARNGTLSRQRLLYRFPTPAVDGLAVDEHGRIWVARLENKSMDVLSPAGKWLASYPVGGDRVTNLAWREKSLYVTVAGKAGAIYRLDLDVRGAP
jgi:gluconolactonase